MGGWEDGQQGEEGRHDAYPCLVGAPAVVCRQEGVHRMTGTRIPHYSEPWVLRFLLSNLRWSVPLLCHSLFSLPLTILNMRPRPLCLSGGGGWGLAASLWALPLFLVTQTCGRKSLASDAFTPSPFIFFFLGLQVGGRSMGWTVFSSARFPL